MTTRWLDDDELSAWLPLMAVLLRVPARLDAQLRRDSGLSLYEYLVLAHLSQQPSGTMGLKALSTVTNGSLSRLSHVVSRLEGRDLVSRRTHPDDGRLTEAVLTERGHAMLDDAAPGHVAAARELVIDRLSKAQIADLREICAAIARPLVDDLPA